MLSEFDALILAIFQRVFFISSTSLVPVRVWEYRTGYRQTAPDKAGKE